MARAATARPALAAGSAASAPVPSRRDFDGGPLAVHTPVGDETVAATSITASAAALPAGRFNVRAGVVESSFNREGSDEDLPGSPRCGHGDRGTGSGPLRAKAAPAASRRPRDRVRARRVLLPPRAVKRTPNTKVAPIRFSSDSRSPMSASPTSWVLMIGTARSDRPILCSEARSIRPTGSPSNRQPSSNENSFRRARSARTRCSASIAISRTICSPTRSACEYSARSATERRTGQVADRKVGHLGSLRPAAAGSGPRRRNRAA